jgi:type IV pilus assembly protein PilQ
MSFLSHMKERQPGRGYRQRLVCGLFLLVFMVVRLPGSEEGQKSDGLISLNLTNVSMKNTLELLIGKMKKNLLLDPALEHLRLNMVLRDVTPRQAFDAILEAHNLGYTELAGGIYHIASPEKISNSMVVKNIPLKYASATELEGIVKSVVLSGSGSVTSDPRTNTLIIRESLEVIAEMERLIAELDRSARQVYIQAEILEISATDDTEFGVEWLTNRLKTGSVEGRVGTDFEIRAPTAETVGTAGSGNGPTPDGFPYPNRSKSGLGIGILHTDISAVLHALNEMNNVNWLSRPRVVTVDNQESVIEVGDQIPYKKLNEFGVTSFEFKDATVQLLVTPHVIDNEYIMLEVAPKADFQNGVTLEGTPIISTRRASTHVKVRDGQTIVIGGLIRDSVIRNVKRVPILGRIPILGALFSSQKSTKVKTELIVFITPVILRDETAPVIFEREFQTREQLDHDMN